MAEFVEEDEEGAFVLTEETIPGVGAVRVDGVLGVRSVGEDGVLGVRSVGVGGMLGVSIGSPGLDAVGVEATGANGGFVTEGARVTDVLGVTSL